MRRGAGGGAGLPLPSTTQLIRSLRIFLERLALLPYTWTKLDSSKVCGRTHVQGKTWRYLVPALLWVSAPCRMEMIYHLSEMSCCRAPVVLLFVFN